MGNSSHESQPGVSPARLVDGWHPAPQSSVQPSLEKRGQGWWMRLCPCFSLSCTHHACVIEIQLEAPLQLMYKHVHGARLLNPNKAHHPVQLMVPSSSSDGGLSGFLSGPPGCFRLPPCEVPAACLQIQGVPAAAGAVPLWSPRLCVFGSLVSDAHSSCPHCPGPRASHESPAGPVGPSLDEQTLSPPPLGTDVGEPVAPAVACSRLVSAHPAVHP